MDWDPLDEIERGDSIEEMIDLFVLEMILIAEHLDEVGPEKLNLRRESDKTAGFDGVIILDTLH